MKYWTGIGSRQAPQDILDQCTLIAGLLERLGMTLRSGGAIGCDQAFERGVENPLLKEILRPKHSTTEAEKRAALIHPRWDLCDEYARRLHGRNVQLVLGNNLDSHSSLLVCWTLSPEKGGTRTGLVLARSLGIPTFNLADPNENAIFMEKLGRAFK